MTRERLGVRPLSAREAEVLTMRRLGFSYKEIAYELEITLNRVGNCLANAEAKGWKVPRRPSMKGLGEDVH